MICGECGYGEELGELIVWRDADNEGWWMHEICLEMLGAYSDA